MLKRNEQAGFVRVFSSLLASGMSVEQALRALKEDYREKGLIDAELPSFLKRFQKGYVSSLIEDAVAEIEMGTKPSEAVKSLSFLDEDVRKSLSRAVEGEVVDRMSEALADSLEEESDMLGKLKNILFTPLMVLVVMFVLVYVVCFKLAPTVGNIVSHPERLPAGPRLALYVYHHPVYYFLFVASVSLTVFLFLKSGVWKKLVPAYKDFERMRFLNWLKILTESGFSYLEALRFLEEGFAGKIGKDIESAIAVLESGGEAGRTLDELSFLLHTDKTFISAGIKSGDISTSLDPLLKTLKKEVRRSIEMTANVFNTLMLVAGGLLVGIVYGGVVIPLTTGIQRAM